MGKIVGIIGTRLPVISNAMRTERRHQIRQCVTDVLFSIKPVDHIVITLDDHTGPWIAHTLRTLQVPYTAVVSAERPPVQKCRYYKNKAAQVLSVWPDKSLTIVTRRQLSKDFMQKDPIHHCKPDVLKRMICFMTVNQKVIDMSTDLIHFVCNKGGVTAWTTVSALEKFNDESYFRWNLGTSAMRGYKTIRSINKTKELKKEITQNLSSFCAADEDDMPF